MILKLKVSKTKKGAITINTLVTVVIGIIVLVVVAYLIFFYSKESSFECRFCSSKFAEWCQKCLVAGDNWNRSNSGRNWATNVPMSDDLKDCKGPCLNIAFQDCNNPHADDECRKYIIIPTLTAS